MEMIKPGMVGVYAIINNINDKIYIGSSSDISVRFNCHKSSLNRNVHCNPYLQRSWNKYGKVNFTFKLLEICSIEDQLICEQKYIDSYKKTHKMYNMAQVAGTSLGLKRSEETLKKMSDWQIGVPKPHLQGKQLSPEHIEKIRQANTGYRHAESSKELNRQAHIGNTHTEESKRRIAEFQTGRTRSEKTKHKMSISKLGRTVSEETRKKLSEYNKSLNKTMTESNKDALRQVNIGNQYTKGRIQTEEEKQRRSESMKRFKEYQRKEKQITSILEEIMIPSCELKYKTYPISAHI